MTGMGQVIAYRSMQLAIKKAKAHGMGMVAVRNSTHYGIAGYYASMAADAGCIGITGTNARPSIAPTFGVENMLGTNPLTVGLPTDEDFPFLLDCATSITQRGKIEYYARVGKDTPAGMVIGRDGSALTDSDSILIRLNDGSRRACSAGRHRGGARRLQGIWLCDNRRDFVGGTSGWQLSQNADRHSGREESPLSSGAFLHCDRYRGVHGA